MHARVQPGQAVNQAVRQQAGDQQISGDDAGDDRGGVGDGAELDEDGEPEPDDDAHYPVFRSDVPGHC